MAKKKKEPERVLVKVRKAADKANDKAGPTVKDTNSEPLHHTRRAFPRGHQRSRHQNTDQVEQEKPSTGVLSMITCIRCQYEGFVPFAARKGEQHLCPDCYLEVTRPKDAVRSTRTHYCEAPQPITCSKCKAEETVNFRPVPQDILCQRCYFQMIHSRRAPKTS